jgi:glycine cleavage system H protein
MTALLVAGTIILFLVIDWAVRRQKEKVLEPQRAAQAMDGAYPIRVPNGIFFAKSHTWVNLFPSGKVQLGLDDLVGRVLLKPEILFLKQEGDKVEKNDPILALVEGERRLTVRSPISGEILSVNQGLKEHPQLMRESLFSQGWAFSIQPTRPEELRAMALGSESLNWMQEEFRRLREFLAGFVAGAGQPILALQDGGAPASGALEHLDAAAWQRFEDDFLNVK